MRYKVAILSNVTVELLANKLKRKCDVFVPGGFNNLASYILNLKSEIYTKKFDVIFVLLDGYESKSWTQDKAFEIYDLWRNLTEQICKNIRNAPVFLSTIAIQGNKVVTVNEYTFWRKWITNWYEHIQELVQKYSNVYIFDVEQLIYDYGKKNFYSSKMWYMGSMPYSKEGLEILVEEMIFLLESMKGHKQRGIALDLDNTLWGGVIGEDGIDGIALSNHNNGEQYYDFQRMLLEMKKRGVLLTILSKNNQEDVSAMWSHPEMLIHREDLVDERINWRDKCQNLIEIQENLNLTEGAFVFIDDNPVEREQMRTYGEGTIVPEFPHDTTELQDFALMIYKKYFRELKETEEDRKRTELYRQEKKRKCECMQATSLEDYLKKLELCVDIHPMRESEIERVVQLVNKTNQFNVTTKRYSETDIRNMYNDINCTIYTVFTSDKYGINGLVSVLILYKLMGKERKSIYIDSFLMSCRVMGRKLENVIISKIKNFYKGHYGLLLAVYYRTKKNAPVENLYEKLDFEILKQESEKKEYCCKLDKDIQEISYYKEIKFEGGQL